MTIKLLIRHAREDRKILLELVHHLTLLERAGMVTIYHEGKITGGENYRHILRTYMEQAQIILPLISHNFVASDAYIELEQALQWPPPTQPRIIPIIIRAVDWQISPLGKVQMLPDNHIPVRNWQDRDHAWTSIAQYIRVVVTELMQTHPSIYIDIPVIER